MSQVYDVAVVGAGAAGLMAAIQAARATQGLRVVVLDGAKHLGAKILVAGGGRCNVTHHVVDAGAFAGSSQNSVRKVLGRFPVDDTIRFFSDEGVELKREETGKLFPVTDQAQTVLDALLGAAKKAGVEILHPWRVASIELGQSEEQEPGYRLIESGGALTLSTRRVILATGGKSLPKSGSNGAGYGLATNLGHTITPDIFPALVPLLLPKGHLLTELSGISFPARLTVQRSGGKAMSVFEDAVLCTHFGLSGPGVLDISRYWRAEQLRDHDVKLILDMHPNRSREELEQGFQSLGGRTVVSLLGADFPVRLAKTLMQLAGVPLDRTGASLSRDERKRLAKTLKEQELPIVGDRGWRYAEVTAGGVPLSELRLSTMESRACRGLHLCGEICDVDGRIGGFNFQWAWASGTVAGRGAALSVTRRRGGAQ